MVTLKTLFSLRGKPFYTSSSIRYNWWKPMPQNPDTQNPEKISFPGVKKIELDDLDNRIRILLVFDLNENFTISEYDICEVLAKSNIAEFGEIDTYFRLENTDLKKFYVLVTIPKIVG